MPVLDNSFIVDLLRGNEEALKKLAEMEAEYVSLSTTEINVLELYRGAYRSMKIHQVSTYRTFDTLQRFLKQNSLKNM